MLRGKCGSPPRPHKSTCTCSQARCNATCTTQHVTQRDAARSTMHNRSGPYLARGVIDGRCDILGDHVYEARGLSEELREHQLQQRLRVWKKHPPTTATAHTSVAGWSGYVQREHTHESDTQNIACSTASHAATQIHVIKTHSRCRRALQRHGTDSTVHGIHVPRCRSDRFSVTPMDSSVRLSTSGSSPSTWE